MVSLKERISAGEPLLLKTHARIVGGMLNAAIDVVGGGITRVQAKRVKGILI